MSKFDICPVKGFVCVHEFAPGPPVRPTSWKVLNKFFKRLKK